MSSSHHVPNVSPSNRRVRFRRSRCAGCRQHSRRASADAAVNSKLKAVQAKLGGFGIPIGPPDGGHGAKTGRGLSAARFIYWGTKGREPLHPWEVDFFLSQTGLPPARPEFATLTVDQTAQVLYWVQNGKFAAVIPTTTGRRGHRTPNGRSRICDKWAGWHNSSKYPSPGSQGNMYDSMYFFDRSDGIAVHGSNEVRTYPDSHGCARIAVADADRIFPTVRNGTSVWVFGTPA